MVSYVFVFWLIVTVMAAVGMVRGWAKEVLVTFSAITALFGIKLIALIPPEFAGFTQLADQFIPKVVFFLVLVFFGYQTPRTLDFIAAASRREHMRDGALGLVFGALNGYLIGGSLWHFLDKAGYPFDQLISPHLASDLVVAGPIGQQAAQLAAEAVSYLAYMPPQFLLAGPWIYFLMAGAFAFVLIVFV